MTTREDILSLAVDAMEDAASGMRYVRENYGDLSGVGFDRVQEKYLNVISKLRAAPTPPAAEAPGQEPVADGWCTRCGCGNDARGYGHLESCSTSAPPTYADAEAKGLEKAAHVALDENYAAIAAGQAAKTEGQKYRAIGRSEAAIRIGDHIRSLASPAPKGEGQ
ncbi:hypothetical protein [Kaistia sp. UC242_56]|uniref:hypothetical protein n=1 Tax=Kaistia sp. UC242_56 TaxID=3374625 RepID=UPI00379D71FA